MKSKGGNMKIIKKFSDIEAIISIQKISDNFLEVIGVYFRNLYLVLGNGCPKEEFTLEDSGHIVILETGDNANNLLAAGITGKLAESHPEAVERIKLIDGTAINKISILCNNEFMITIFSSVGQLDENVEAWLNDEAISLNVGNGFGVL